MTQSSFKNGNTFISKERKALEVMTQDGYHNGRIDIRILLPQDISEFRHLPHSLHEGVAYQSAPVRMLNGIYETGRNPQRFVRCPDKMWLARSAQISTLN